MTVSGPNANTNTSASSTAAVQPSVDTHVSSGSGISLSVESLSFYHAQPIVPIPPGMEPIPVLSNTTFPSMPHEQVSTSTDINWYLITSGVNPGLHRSTWEEIRANIEVYRGLPNPFRPDFVRVRVPLAERLPRMRVLPPPPRPPVEREGQHYWVVYVGRVPGIYSTL